MSRLSLSHRALNAPVDLEYHGRPMNPQPANMLLANVAARLIQSVPVYVALEPGDGTRYDLVLVPLDGVKSGDDETVGLPYWEPAFLMVTRLVSGSPIASVIIGGIPDGSLGMSELVPLTNNNEWTLELLEWWIARLWATIEERGGL